MRVIERDEAFLVTVKVYRETETGASGLAITSAELEDIIGKVEAYGENLLTGMIHTMKYHPKAGDFLMIAALNYASELAKQRDGNELEGS